MRAALWAPFWFKSQSTVRHRREAVDLVVFARVGPHWVHARECAVSKKYSAVQMNLGTWSLRYGSARVKAAEILSAHRGFENLALLGVIGASGEV